MAWRDDAPSEAATPSARGSPTRRRLLALLGGLPAIGPEAVGAGQPSPPLATLGLGTDPIPRLFAEFQGLLERHEAALVCCDRLEAGLLAQIDYPRVILPLDWQGARGHAADALTIAETVPPGRHQRRLQRVLQRRQRRWDAAADGAGLTVAQAHKAALDGAVLDRAEGLLATPARNLDEVVLKLLVLLSTQEPGPSARGTSPWRELRLMLLDLRGLTPDREIAP